MPYQHHVRDATKTPDAFTLKCKRRDNGGLQIECPEVPGMYLSGDNVRQVLRDVAPALRSLISHNAKKT